MNLDYEPLEEEKDDGGNHGKVLIFDDRIITDN